MDIQSEVNLSDILPRAKKLESILPFRTQLTIPTIIQRSKNISTSSVDKRAGYLNLSRLGVNVQNTEEILSDIGNIRVFSDNFINFRERTDFCYQDIIIKSINKVQNSTEKLNDNLLLRTLQRRQIENSNLNDQKIHDLVAVPIHNLDPSLLHIYGDEVKMELVEKSKFYCNLLPKFDENMAKNIFDAIISSTEKIFNYESQRHFADTFNLIHNLQIHRNSRNWIIEGSIAFLESQKKLLIRTEVNSSLRYADRGGKIGFTPTIKAYLNLRNSSRSESPWAILFYAIRCGVLKEASSYAEESDVDTDVKTAIDYYSNHIPLTGSLRETLIGYLDSEFISTRFDIYKVLTLSVLTKSRRNIKQKDKIKIQDWLWYELQFTEDVSILANMLSEKHQFDQPDLQGQILMMVGCFDEAAQWFLDRLDYTKDNLHVALCIHVAGFIPSKILLQPLIKHSVEVFKANQEAAVRYLSLIREHENRINSLAELVIKATHGYQMFESGIKIDERDMTAPIMKVLLPADVNEVIQKAASEARRLNRYELAIKLYLLRSDYLSILSYDCVRLCQIIEGFANNEALETVIQHFALIQEEEKKLGDNRSVDISSLNTMELLIRIACGCEFERVGNFEKAAIEFESSDIFPQQSELAEAKYAQLLKMPEIVQRVVPFIIVPALRAYYNMFLSMQREANLSNYREKLKVRSEGIREFASLMDLGGETQAMILNLFTTIK